MTRNYTSWRAESKDHAGAFDPAVLTSYALSIKRTLTRSSPTGPIDVGQIISKVFTDTSSTLSHPRMAVALEDGYVLSGGGAEVQYGNGFGNLLWDLEPYVNGFTAASKDHGGPDACPIQTYAMGVQLVPIGPR
ncbi:hypothetical protein KSB_92830 [Ktedonobacter robiniae]|uniref:Uncharacterized protein n=1 Tax=Ktedonobacter robiniae TaxID=2778365 RepID=A0ABQ3V769_9CHLR|nr:hypothetical protein KSB_92830 [Ktedonobacter robiniae]